MSHPLRTSLTPLRRRFYLIGLPLSAAATAAIWWLERQQGVLHAFDRYGLPPLSGFFALLWLLVARRALELARIERALFAVFSLFMVGSLSFTLLTSAAGAVAVGDLAGAGYWFPVVYCLAFLIFDERTGRRLAAALFATSLLLGIAHLLHDPDASLLILSQLYVANGLVLLLVGTFAHLARRQAEDALALERLATTDPLTSLGNRRRLEVQVSFELLRAARYGSGFAVLLLDIDHFKRVNDEHGHDVGDEVLRRAGALLSGSLREVDAIGRWGGEEFLILTPGLDAAGARRFAERLRAALAAHRFPGPGRVTCSFGVAAHRRGDTLASLVRRADEALYRAKGAGRDRVEVA